MASNDLGEGTLHDARPGSGDLVDRVLAAKLRRQLFGATDEVHLGRLRIEGALGRGGMGSILSAFDPVLDRRVAIKTLLPEHKDDRDQLLREARMLAKLSHANIVSIYDVVEDHDGVYLVMEQVEGGDLRAWLVQPRSWQEIVELFTQLGHGLAAAHALGIAHCDVKPDNVVVSEGRPRLIDFGLAHQRTDAPSHAGTPAYLAPERVAGAGGSAAADQYAFFASLVEAIEGKRPTDGNPWERMPGWLQKVARRGLHPDPAQRYPDMRAAVAALRRTPLLTKVLAATAVALLAGLVTVALVLRARTAADHEVCAGADAKIATIWTPATRDAMRAAFAATGAPQAAATWARVEARLDHYTADWIKLRTQSCVATRVHGEQSVELLDYSMYCFDQQLDSLASLTTVFTAPNPAVVKGADKAMGELANLGACVDPAALAQAVALPADRDRLHRLQARYDAIKNLDRRGQYRESFAGTEALAVDARALAFPPLTVRVLTLRGALQVTLGDPAAAEKTFREAASEAAKARDDRKVAEVWIRVLELVAQQGRQDEALTLEPVATTSAERVPDALEIQARLLNTLGGIYLAKARYQDAHTAYGKALALQRKLGADGNLALTSAISNFGLSKWYLGDLRGALTDLEEALPRMLSELGPDHANVGYLRQNLGDLHRQLGEPDLATPEYLEVVRIWTESLGPDHANLANPYEQLALLSRRRRDFPTARAQAEQALRLRERLGPSHPLVAQTLTVVAEVAIAEGTPASLARADQAVARGLTILRGLGEAGKRQLVYLLESHAQLAELHHDAQAALRDREEVLALRIATLGDHHRDTARSYGQVGSTQLRLGLVRDGEANLVRAIALFDAEPTLPADDAIALIVTRAELRLRQHAPAEAIKLLEDAVTRAAKAEPATGYEVRFALARAQLALGTKPDRATALEGVRRLRAELPAHGHEALAAQLDRWLANPR